MININFDNTMNSLFFIFHFNIFVFLFRFLYFVIFTENKTKCQKTNQIIQKEHQFNLFKVDIKVNCKRICMLYNNRLYNDSYHNLYFLLLIYIFTIKNLKSKLCYFLFCQFLKYFCTTNNNFSC